MATYTTLQAVTSMIPAEIIQQLTDDANINEIGQDNVNYCITLASDVIDGYLMGHYPLPLPWDTPPLIIDLATKLTVYFLYQRSLIMTMPEPLEKVYKWCLDTLKQIQLEKINPFPITENSAHYIGGAQFPGGKLGQLYTGGWRKYFIKGEVI